MSIAPRGRGCETQNRPTRGGCEAHFLFYSFYLRLSVPATLIDSTIYPRKPIPSREDLSPPEFSSVVLREGVISYSTDHMLSRTFVP